MVINEDGEYEFMSDGELEALQHVARHQQVNQDMVKFFVTLIRAPVLLSQRS